MAGRQFDTPAIWLSEIAPLKNFKYAIVCRNPPRNLPLTPMRYRGNVGPINHRNIWFLKKLFRIIYVFLNQCDYNNYFDKVS